MAASGIRDIYTAHHTTSHPSLSMILRRTLFDFDMKNQKYVEIRGIAAIPVWIGMSLSWAPTNMGFGYTDTVRHVFALTHVWCVRVRMCTLYMRKLGNGYFNCGQSKYKIPKKNKVVLIQILFFFLFFPQAKSYAGDTHRALRELAHTTHTEIECDQGG